MTNCEVPEQFGGLGLSCVDHCLLLEEVAYGCLGVKTTLAANMLGSMPIIIAGTDEQKSKYLGMLTSEPVHAAYACSEPDAGSGRREPQHQVRAARRRVRDHWAEALDHQRGRGSLVHRARDEGQGAQAQGHHVLRRRRGRARRSDRQERAQDGSAARTRATSTSKKCAFRRARSWAARATASRSR